LKSFSPVISVNRGGFLRGGITAPGILGGSGYLYELPDNRIYSAQWD
jgi:hypothetical protein